MRSRQTEQERCERWIQSTLIPPRSPRRWAGQINTACYARMEGHTRATTSMTVIMWTKIALQSTRVGIQPDPSPMIRDGTNFAQIIESEVRKAFWIITKKLHRHKNHHTNDSDSHNESDNSSWSYRFNSTRELHTCKKTKLHDSINRYTYPISVKLSHKLK